MENLLITTLYRSDNTIFIELTKLAGKFDCRINYSHFFSLGPDYIMAMQIAGNWSSIAKIEATLPALAKQHEIELVFKRTHQEKINRYSLPYQIDIVALDQPGLIYEIIEFFYALDVHIQHLETLPTTSQETPILRFNMKIGIPKDVHIAEVREQFLLFCDELNIDGSLEPIK